MAQSPDGVVDLTAAASILNVKKRRIYDVTNVLEGVDLVSRCRKSTMMWVGSRSSTDSDVAERAAALRTRIAELENARRNLEEDIHLVLHALRAQERDEEVVSNAYVRLSDLSKIPALRNSNALVVTGSHDIEVFVSPTHHAKRRRVTLLSSDEPLDVILCNPSCFNQAGVRRPSDADPSDSASSTILRR